MEARLGPPPIATSAWSVFNLSIEPSVEAAFLYRWLWQPVYPFTVLQPHRSLTLIARTRVETLLSNPFLTPERPAVPDEVENWPFRQFAARWRQLAEVQALAERFSSCRRLRSACGASRCDARDIWTFEYQSQVTTVSSTVAELLVLRKGVCQDFAHMMIAVCVRWGCLLATLVAISSAGRSGALAWRRLPRLV